MVEASQALIIALLRSHSVTYRELSGSLLAQLPSPRLTNWVVVFPGSKSPFSHVIFLSITTECSILLMAFSKTLVSSSEASERMLITAMDVNHSAALKDLGIWSIESRQGQTFPVLSTMILKHEFKKSTVWKAIGLFDATFKASAQQFTTEQQSVCFDLQDPVRAFLVQTGFKKIKETTVGNGVSFLVVLSCDDFPEESPSKRFPMKLTVTDNVTIRVYFSQKDAAVVAKKAFLRSAERLIAFLNPILAVGYWSLASESHQCQLVLTIPGKTLSPSDFQAALNSAYTQAITIYKWSVPLFVALYEKDNNAEISASDVEELLSLASEETKTLVLDYSHDTRLLTFDLALIQKLESLPEFHKYTTRIPMLRLLSERKATVRTETQLTPVEKVLELHADARATVWHKYLALIETCSKLGVFPRVGMVFVSEEGELKVVPGKGFLTDIGECLAEVIQMVCSVVENIRKPVPIDQLFELESIDFGAFAGWRETECWGVQMCTADLAGNCYLFHPVNLMNIDKRFVDRFHTYRSQLEKSGLFPSAIIGVTESDADGSFLLVEKYEWKVVGNYSLETLRMVLRFTAEMHAKGFVHLAINPAFVRQHEITKAIAFAMPMANLCNAKFMKSVILPEYEPFLAPEIREFIDTGKGIDEKYATKGDVFSVCQLIQRCLIATEDEKSQAGFKEFDETVTKGLDFDPLKRPEIEDLERKLRNIHRNAL